MGDRKTARLFAYLLVVTLALFVFVRQEQIVNRLDANRVEAEKHNCVALAQGREVLRELVGQISADRVAPPGADPALIQSIAETNAQSQRFKDFALPRVQPPNCSIAKSVTK